ncbi:LytR/AlgR family response regulator transcription factor [Anaeromicropila populeti]|uniref:Stage 0 sporulation protein A homolog n=1 Tax=Anaeromicropila populeti TaxID=37658 RepID=A0A1I6JNF3_9FIRM|nr:LytTR family DNA-binding domain-containing protein [Anaeromicropila populeti]SFR80477.1 two component transcriptional regulator, LytTR family [Anaeromicropila populeti]
MKIAICDDEMKELGEIEDIIYSCFNKESQRIECDGFLSSEELLEVITRGDRKYQIYILDIEMPGMSGLELAEQIRQRDRKAVIIFETSHKELMQKAFDVLAFHFILKPIDKLQMSRILQKAVEHVNSTNALFHFQFSKKKYSIAYQDILYFESYRRLIRIYLIDKQYEYYGTMADLKSRLNMSVFVQTHVAFVVNMEYIETYQGDYVCLKGGISVPVSKGYSKYFNQTYRDFVLTRM